MDGALRVSGTVPSALCMRLPDTQEPFLPLGTWSVGLSSSSGPQQAICREKHSREGPQTRGSPRALCPSHPHGLACCGSTLRPAPGMVFARGSQGPVRGALPCPGVQPSCHCGDHESAGCPAGPCTAALSRSHSVPTTVQSHFTDKETGRGRLAVGSAPLCWWLDRVGSRSPPQGYWRAERGLASAESHCGYWRLCCGLRKSRPKAPRYSDGCWVMLASSGHQVPRALRPSRSSFQSPLQAWPRLPAPLPACAYFPGLLSAASGHMHILARRLLRASSVCQAPGASPPLPTTSLRGGGLAGSGSLHHASGHPPFLSFPSPWT